MGNNDFGAAHWASDKVWARRKKDAKAAHQLITTDPAFWKSSVEVRMDILTLMAVHGSLCLTLRHPAFQGSSRKLVEAFKSQVGEYLVTLGALTPEQLRKAELLEAPEG